MKKIVSTLILFTLITSCHHYEDFCLNDESVTTVPHSVNLEPFTKKSGIERVEYVLIKEDLSGDPFKIKLYLYSNDTTKHEVADLSKQCASAFLKKVNGVEGYKLIEVTLVSNGEESESVFYHTSKLADI